jgi:hypothetical protein
MSYCGYEFGDLPNYHFEAEVVDDNCHSFPRQLKYAGRLCEFQDLKEELGLYSSYREFIDTNVYNLNAAIRSIETKHELFKDIEYLDTIRYLDDPNKPYVHKPFQPFDEELNDITFSCPICADEFCIHDVDTENLPVSVYIACKHVACNKCIEIMRKRFTLNPYHCPFCRQASFQITPINDALLRQTVLFCEYAIIIKKNILAIDKKKKDLECVKKMNKKMNETLIAIDSEEEKTKLGDLLNPDTMSKMSRIQKKRRTRYVNKLHTRYMSLKDKYTKTIAESAELQEKHDKKLKQMQYDLTKNDVFTSFDKAMCLKIRIMSDYNNMSVD